MRNISQIRKENEQEIKSYFNISETLAEGVNFFFQTDQSKPAVDSVGKIEQYSQAEFLKKQLYKKDRL